MLCCGEKEGRHVMNAKAEKSPEVKNQGKDELFRIMGNIFDENLLFCCQYIAVMLK